MAGPSPNPHLAAGHLLSAEMKTQVLALIAVVGRIALASAETQLRRLRDVQGLLHMDDRPTVSLAFAKKAEDQLLHFLESERSLESTAASLPPYEDFMPACLAHTKDLVSSIDESYTDMQTRKVLEDECLLDKEFTVKEDCFDDHQACMKFAKELAAARMKELKTGSVKGYKAFCERYFVHKGGEKPKKKEKKPKKAKKDEKKKQKDMEESKETETSKVTGESLAPAAAPVASPISSPGPSPAAAPSPAPEAFAPAPAPAVAASIKEEEEELSKASINEEDAKKHGDLHWWGMVVIIVGVLLLIVAGAIVHSRSQ